MSLQHTNPFGATGEFISLLPGLYCEKGLFISVTLQSNRGLFKWRGPLLFSLMAAPWRSALINVSCVPPSQDFVMVAFHGVLSLLSSGGVKFWDSFPWTEADFWVINIEISQYVQSIQYFYLILLAYEDKKGPSQESHVSISSESPRHEFQALLRLKSRIRVKITVKALKSSLCSSRNRTHIFMLSFTPSSFFSIFLLLTIY